MTTPQRPGERRRHIVARATEVADGERIIVEVDGKSIGIFNVEGRFYALLNRCPHQGAALCKGDVLRTKVTSSAPGEFEFDTDAHSLICPWHGWEYELATGKSWWDGRHSRVRAYEVEVEHGVELANAIEEAEKSGDRVEGPYVAVVVPISIEDDYIVLTI